MNRTNWSTPDFEEMSWHDAHVYGFKLIANEEEGVADIIFDIDYIVEWLCSGGEFNFLVAQASLRFHDASELRLSLDYKARSAGMCPFSIAGIERISAVYPNGYKSFEWTIDINWPSGKIEFNAPRFTQTLVGSAYKQAGQRLDPELRN